MYVLFIYNIAKETSKMAFLYGLICPQRDRFNFFYQDGNSKVWLMPLGSGIVLVKVDGGNEQAPNA